MPKPLLSIVVTSCQAPALAKLCVKTIKATLSNLDYEIIVSDDNSDSVTRELFKDQFPEIKFIAHKKNVGLSYSVNSALRISRGDFIAIFNNDIIITPDSLENMVKFLEKNPHVGLIGPKLLNFDSTPQSSCFRPYTLTTIIARRTPLGKTGFGKKALNRFLMTDFNCNSIKPVDWLMGSAYLTSRKALEKVGYWDSRNFFLYFEDVDWCRRFWEKRLPVIYFPISKVYHYHGKQSAKKKGIIGFLSNKSARAHLKSAYRYFKKYKKDPYPQTFMTFKENEIKINWP
jgi:GT2 family glycosyltransferase